MSDLCDISPPTTHPELWRPKIENETFVVAKQVYHGAFNWYFIVYDDVTGKITAEKPVQIDSRYESAGIKHSI